MGYAVVYTGVRSMGHGELPLMGHGAYATLGIYLFPMTHGVYTPLGIYLFSMGHGVSGPLTPLALSVTKLYPIASDSS